MNAGTRTRAQQQQIAAQQRNKSHTTVFKLKALDLATELKSIRLAARQLKINEKCIRNWKSQHALLVAALPNVRRLAVKRREAPYHEIEDKLYDEICELQQQHNNRQKEEEKRVIITRAWIIGRFQEMVKAQHAKHNNEPPQRRIYTSHSRWYDNFLRRKNISLRTRRKPCKKNAGRWKEPAASRAQLWPRFAHFHCFVRKLAAPPQNEPPPEPERSNHVGKYALRAIGHFDEIPIAVGCSEQQQQNVTNGAVACSRLFKPRQYHTSSSGGCTSFNNDDYVATFVPFICADGCTFIKPIIIFKEFNSQIISRSERYYYDKRVVVYANSKAWIDDAILADIVARFRAETVGEPARLLVFDSSPHHVTQNVFEACAENNVDYAVVPVGCNQYLQPLDRGVIDEWKIKFIEALDEAFTDTDGGFLRLTARQRRIKLTSLIASTWCDLLCSIQGSELIRQAFKKTGIAVKPDGSEDTLISIDGHAEYTIAAGLEGITDDDDDERKWIYDRDEYDDDDEDEDDRHNKSVMKDEKVEAVSANEEAESSESEEEECGCYDAADASLQLQMQPVAFAELEQNVDDDDEDMTDFDRLEIDDADALL